MLRKLILAGALAALAVPSAAWAQPPVTLMPGITYERELTFTPHGPVVLHVLTAPRPGGLYALRPALSNGVIPGLDKLTGIEAALSTQTTAAGINGDFYATDGHPTGIVMQGGSLVLAPFTGRTSIGVDSTGQLHLDKLAYVGNWHGTGQRRRLLMNLGATNNSDTLYTPAFGPATPPSNSDVELVLPSLPATPPGRDLLTQVGEVRTSGGTSIPAGGAVLVGRGTQAPILKAEAPAGQAVTIRLTLTPGWAGVTDALGGGPLLVRNGKPIFDASEPFSTAQLVPRQARSAVGQLRDGRIVLVVADGGQPGYSVGMTNFELAVTMAHLGAVTAAALGVGGPAAMAFDGQLLDRPSAPGGEAPLADALLVSYDGVYAPPPSVAVVSPNGDGVADSTVLAYKIVRPSSVSAQLLGPDGRAYGGDSGARPAGTQDFAFPGPTASPAALPEGTYRWIISATDDLGRQSSIERDVLVDSTLAGLTLDQPLFRVGPAGGTLSVGVTLAHPAAVVATIETSAGAVLRTLDAGTLQPGAQTILWDARDSRGRLIRSARLLARVRATNSIGTVDLVAPFTLKRVA